MDLRVRSSKIQILVLIWVFLLSDRRKGVIPHWPTTFDFEGNKVKIIYLEGENKPYYNATTVAQALGLKNASNSGLAAVDSLVERIKRYCELGGKQVESGKTLKIANSVRVAEVMASDGLITVLKVSKSNRATSHFYYYYNQEGLYEVLLNSNAEGALRFRYWVTHDVLPAIAKYGIGMRRCLTDAIKRLIDLNRASEMAYPTITDVVYIIRYGMNSNQLRRHLGLEEGDNIREHLSQEELQALAKILTGALNLGLTMEQVMGNKEFVALHRKPL